MLVSTPLETYSRDRSQNARLNSEMGYFCDNGTPSQVWTNVRLPSYRASSLGT